jgi:hypothetical protein
MTRARLAVALMLALIPLGAVAKKKPPATTESTPTAPRPSLNPATVAKPKVPVGVDPGGISIALVGPGIDYTLPDIAARLARDGEGELIGFDLIDMDRRPFTTAPPSADRESMTAIASALLRQPVAVRLQIFRTKSHDVATNAQAIGMAALAKTRTIVLWAPPTEVRGENLEHNQAFLSEAAARFPTVIVVPVPRTNQQRGSEQNQQRGSESQADDTLSITTSDANDVVRQLTQLARKLTETPNATTEELRTELGTAAAK